MSTSAKHTFLSKKVFANTNWYWTAECLNHCPLLFCVPNVTPLMHLKSGRLARRSFLLGHAGVILELRVYLSHVVVSMSRVWEVDKGDLQFELFLDGHSHGLECCTSWMCLLHLQWMSTTVLWHALVVPVDAQVGPSFVYSPQLWSPALVDRDRVPSDLHVGPGEHKRTLPDASLRFAQCFSNPLGVSWKGYLKVASSSLKRATAPSFSAFRLNGDSNVAALLERPTPELLFFRIPPQFVASNSTLSVCSDMCMADPGSATHHEITAPRETSMMAETSAFVELCILFH